MPAGTPSTVRIHAASKRFGEGLPVLEGIELSAAPGDFVGIIGPSGCGKTTLLRLLAGLSKPSEGAISIDGLDPDHAAHNVGFVFQEPTLLPWLDVAKNVRTLHRLAGTGEELARRRCSEAIRLVRLDGYETRYPRQLSGGQRMRVSLARALSVAPSLLLLDEPFGALDEMTREHLNEELLAIRHHQPWTAFFVTHSVAEAVFLSSRIVIMSAHPGRIHSTVEVPFAYPRTSDTRMSAEYLALVARTSRLLRSVEEGAA